MASIQAIQVTEFNHLNRLAVSSICCLPVCTPLFHLFLLCVCISCMRVCEPSQSRAGQHTEHKRRMLTWLQHRLRSHVKFASRKKSAIKKYHEFSPPRSRIRRVKRRLSRGHIFTIQKSRRFHAETTECIFVVASFSISHLSNTTEKATFCMHTCARKRDMQE